MPLLEIRNLSVRFPTRHGAFTAVDGVDVSVDRDESLAIVGESGSGKSVAMLAVMGLLPPTARVSADLMRFDSHDLLTMSAKARRDIAGRDIDLRKYRGQLAADHESDQLRTIDLGHRACTDVASIPQHRHAIGDLRKLLQAMRDVNHPDALAAKLLYHAEQVLHFAVT